MDKGHIVEIGSPQELMAQEGSHFYKLARSAGINISNESEQSHL